MWHKQSGLMLMMVIAAVAACDKAGAQTMPATTKPAARRADPFPLVAGQLSSDDPVEFNKGLTLAKKRAATHRPENYYNEWAELLLRRQKYDALDELVLAGMIQRATDLAELEKSQTFRVRVQLLAGHPDQALASAKALYNVCAMATTRDAIDAICECLVVLHPNGESDKIVDQFRLQQTQGELGDAPAAGETQTAQSNNDPANQSLLSQIKCDPEPFKAGLAAFELGTKGFDRLIAKGNFLLLSDQPDSAEQCFRQAYSMKAQANQQLAIEGIARSMRAKDGNVHRANVWILSLKAAAPH